MRSGTLYCIAPIPAGELFLKEYCTDVFARLRMTFDNFNLIMI